LFAQAELVNETAVYLFKGFLVETDAASNLLREVETNVANGLTLEHLLRLVEFIANQFVKVVSEDEILEFCELHGQLLLLDLA